MRPASPTALRVPGPGNKARRSPTVAGAWRAGCRVQRKEPPRDAADWLQSIVRRPGQGADWLALHRAGAADEIGRAVVRADLELVTVDSARLSRLGSPSSLIAAPHASMASESVLEARQDGLRNHSEAIGRGGQTSRRRRVTLTTAMPEVRRISEIPKVPGMSKPVNGRAVAPAAAARAVGPDSVTIRPEAALKAVPVGATARTGPGRRALAGPARPRWGHHRRTGHRCYRYPEQSRT